MAEQSVALKALKGCDAAWFPHYPIPVFADIPLVVTVHDLAHLALRDLYGGVRRLYARSMFQIVRRRAEELLFVSDFTRQEFIRLAGMPRGHMTVVHNGVAPCWTEIPLRERVEPPYFISVGNIKPHKNIRFLCRAFAQIASRCTANLVFVGKSSGFQVGESTPERLMQTYPGRIRFTGWVAHEHLVRLLSGAAGLMFPSRYEGFGLPLLEAMGAGVPVIASDTPVSREVCKDFAVYFPLDSEAALGEKMLELLTMSPEERHAKGEQTRNWARRFSWSNTASAITPILRRVVSM